MEKEHRTAVIIEDEPVAASILERLLLEEHPDLSVIGKAGSIADAVTLLQRVSPDIIFMDVELSDGPCFSIFPEVEIRSSVIMTTAYDSYAIRAFEKGSIDYLLKPIEKRALSRALARCQDHVEGRGEELDRVISILNGSLHPREEEEKSLIFHVNDHILTLRPSQIAYLYSKEKSSNILLHDGTLFTVSSSLDSICASLPGDRFFRISRGSVVSKEAVEKITKILGGRLGIKIKVSGPEGPIYVSRSKSEPFLEWMGK